MFRIKFLLVITALFLLGERSLGQNNSQFEQLAFDYFVEVIANNDSSLIGLQIITKGKVNNIRTQYHEICEDVGSLLDSDSLFLQAWLEEENFDFWRNYDALCN